jgi:hypothetical protein
VKGVVREVRRMRPAAAVDAALAALVDRGLGIRDGDGYLGLPVFDRATLPPAEEREGRRDRPDLRPVPAS